MRGRPKGTKDKNPRKSKNRSKFILFKIEGKKIKYHSTVFGILTACEITGQHNANIYCFVNGKINTLGEWIVIKDEIDESDIVTGYTKDDLRRALEFGFNRGKDGDFSSDQENEFYRVLKGNRVPDAQKYYEQAMMRFYKMEIQQSLVKNESINALNDEKIKTIYELLKDEK